MVNMKFCRLASPLLVAGFILTAYSPIGFSQTLINLPKKGLALQAAAVPATRIGVNMAQLRYWDYSPAFDNLAFGSTWVDSKGNALPAAQQTSDGGINYTVTSQPIIRILTTPASLPQGTAISCTYQGIGSLTVRGYATASSSSPGNLVFTTQTGSGTGFWLVLENVTQSSPFESLVCRQLSSSPPSQFRPEFVQSVTGYPVVRFMDWQDSNANSSVTWATRHLPGDSRYTADGVAIEDMMAIANAVNASPWFVMPWNADDAYIAGFAQIVAQTLPANQSVYVEVGNEVWNSSFAVSTQAKKEGVAENLSTNATVAGAMRYAEKTVYDMKIWEAAFAGRTGLVRVISSQHVQPQNANALFTYAGVVAHTDALATAPYFGTSMPSGTARATIISDLASRLQQTESLGAQNQTVAQNYGKRYVAYEAGQSLQLSSNIPLLTEVENSTEMYSFYTSYLQWWKSKIGDTMNLYTASGPVGGSGAWGLVVNDTDGSQDSAKYRAVLEQR